MASHGCLDGRQLPEGIRRGSGVYPSEAKSVRSMPGQEPRRRCHGRETALALAWRFPGKILLRTRDNLSDPRSRSIGAGLRFSLRAASAARRPAIFVAVGVMSTLIDIAAYTGLTRLLDVAPLMANALAYILGAANGYLMNGLFTFRRSGRPPFSIRSLAAHSATYGTSLVASTVSMALLLYVVPDLAAKLLTVFVTFLINYWLSRNFVFKERDRSSAED
jgi:putative flippase GtrA